MQRGSHWLVTRRPAAGASLIALSFWLAAPIAAARADGPATVTLDDFRRTSAHGDVLTIKHAVFEGANLSKSEIETLLTPDTPAADQLALVKRLKATSIAIPSIDIAQKQGGAIHIHDVAATAVDAGKVGKFAFSGIDGDGTGDDGPISIKSGPFDLENADLSGALDSAPNLVDLAPAARFEHLSWGPLDIMAPDKEAAAQKGSIHVGFASLDSRNNYEGDRFKDSSTTLRGLTIAPSKGTDFAASLGALGYSSVDLSATAVIHYDASGKKLAVDDITIDYANAGSIGLKASFGGVEPTLFAADKGAQIAALAGGEIASVELKLVNGGLFEKAVAYYAAQENTTAKAVKNQWAATAGQLLPAMLGGDPSALKVATEAQKFIASPGNLTIILRPKGEPLKFTDFLSLADPTALLAKIDIEATANR